MTTKEKTVTTKTPTKAEALTLAELEQAETDAMLKVAQARAAAERLRDAENARRQAAQDEHDRQMLAAWPDERRRLEAEVSEARTAFRQAVLADPVWQAYRQQVLAQHRLRTLWLDTSSVSGRLGRGEFGIAPGIDPVAFDDLARLIASDAEQQGRDEQQARAQARENAGQA